MEQDQSLLTFSVTVAPAAGRLGLPAEDFRFLLQKFGPSLGLWRAAEIAALREQAYLMEPPVVDLGCGDGLVTSRVLPWADVGLDPDAQALRNAARLNIYGHLEAAAVEACSLPTGSAGTIVSNSVLEHVPDIDAALAACARLLRPGGRLIFTSPTEAFGPWLALPQARYAAWRNRQLAHLNLWPIERWAECLQGAGFELEFTQPYLRRDLVWGWDALELLQMIWVGRWRLFGLAWRRLPPVAFEAMARRGARLDLSAPPPGGGRLIVARRL